jgi:hypothetical protein
VGKADVHDAYIYCASQVYSRRLREKFGANSCVAIHDADRFLDVVDRTLSDLGLTYPGYVYPGISSGRAIKYVGHSVDSRMRVSGNWLKDVCYQAEAEFRFTFVPIIKRAGKTVVPVSRQKDGVTEFDFPNAEELEISAQPLAIRCKEVIECCRWKG